MFASSVNSRVTKRMRSLVRDSATRHCDTSSFESRLSAKLCAVSTKSKLFITVILYPHIKRAPRLRSLHAILQGVNTIYMLGFHIY